MYLQLCWLTFFKATVYLYGRVGYTKDKRIKNFQFIGSKTKLGNQRFKNVFPSNSTCLSFDCRLSGLQESTKGLEPSQRFPYFLAVALGAKYFNSNCFRRIFWFWICLKLLKNWFQKGHLSIDVFVLQFELLISCWKPTKAKQRFFSPVLTNQIWVGDSNDTLDVSQPIKVWA